MGKPDDDVRDKMIKQAALAAKEAARKADEAAAALRAAAQQLELSRSKKGDKRTNSTGPKMSGDDD